jgi:hypothetical protein
LGRSGRVEEGRRRHRRGWAAEAWPPELKPTEAHLARPVKGTRALLRLRQRRRAAGCASAIGSAHAGARRPSLAFDQYLAGDSRHHPDHPFVPSDQEPRCGLHGRAEYGFGSDRRVVTQRGRLDTTGGSSS